VRLAFAVAAHLEPEILLVDEVLAVGDINFQKKCLGKMGDVARAGRTVVLVSHQLTQIRRLCHRVVWVDDASVRLNGSTYEVVSAYESDMRRREQNGRPQSRGQAARGRFVRWEIADAQPGLPHLLSSLGPVTINFVVELSQGVRNGEHGVALFNSGRQLIWARAAQQLALPPGVHVFSHSFPSLPLRPGPYQWQVSLWDNGEMLDQWDCEPELTIATEVHQHYMDEWNGILNLTAGFVSHCREVRTIEG
jgi:lipopolysaccharide transport system ATP-binding protein